MEPLAEAQRKFWEERETELLNEAGEGFVIDEESIGCDYCGSRIPHNGDVHDYVVVDDEILCQVDAHDTDNERVQAEKDDEG